MTTLHASAFTLQPASPVMPALAPPLLKYSDAIKRVDNTVTISLLNEQATINITADHNNQLTAIINNEAHPLGIENSEKSAIKIRTGNYRDKIKISDNVMTQMDIDSGGNRDFIKSGGSPYTRIRAGSGDDSVILGSGGGSADGGLGNDRMFGGPGRNRLSGGPGTNSFFTAEKHHAHTYIESDGEEDTIELLSGTTKIQAYSGKPTVNVGSEAGVELTLLQSTTGGKIFINDNYNRRNVHIHGFIEGVHKIISK